MSHFLLSSRAKSRDLTIINNQRSLHSGLTPFSRDDRWKKCPKIEKRTEQTPLLENNTHE